MGNTVGDGTTPSQPTEEQLELRLPEEIITKLAFEAEFRDMGIGELIGALIAATMEKDLLQQLLALGERGQGREHPLTSGESGHGFGFAQWARSVRPELKILLAGTPERTVRNAAELCEVGPTLKRPYGHKLVLDRIKRLLAARAQQGGR